MPALIPIERATLMARPMDEADVRPVEWERDVPWDVPSDTLLERDVEWVSAWDVVSDDERVDEEKLDLPVVVATERETPSACDAPRDSV